MEEKTFKSIKKTLIFEKSGEALSVEISLENVSPMTSKDTVLSMLDVLFKKTKEVIF